MDMTELFTLQNLTILIGVVIAVIAAVLIYIVLNAPKKAKKTAVLYDEWSERLGLPALTKNATLNSKAIEKFFKLVWPKKFPEELDVRQEIPNLTQETALAFTLEATEALQPKKSPYIFIYDIDDASSGFLRLFSTERGGRQEQLFFLGQKLLKLIKAAAPITEFAHVELADNVDPTNKEDLESFILTGSDFPIHDEDIYTKILKLLSDEYSGVWLAGQMTDDAILFRRQTEEDLNEEREIPVETNPFKVRLEAKREAEAAQAAEHEAAERAREAAWRQAEEDRRVAEVSARDAAIAAGAVSKYVANPLQFLASELEVAADASELFVLDDEPEILKTDGIGSPILFCVYSNELLIEDDPKVQEFNRVLIASLDKNLGGDWGVEFADASLSFRRGI